MVRVLCACCVKALISISEIYQVYGTILCNVASPTSVLKNITNLANNY